MGGSSGKTYTMRRPPAKACFIFNPRSGHNIRNPQVIQRVRRFIAAQNAAGALDARLVNTERPHHATALARDAIAGGATLIVAIGGDGTINETAAALVNAPAPVALGLIPCGSGNGLGRHLGIPRPDDRALHTLLHGAPRLIDTARADGHPFFNVMGLGFDAQIAAKFRALEKRGLAAYVRVILTELQTFSPIRCRITALANAPAPALTNTNTPTTTLTPATAPIDTRAFVIAIANSDQYGNNARIAPDARIDDGQLDLTLIRRATWLNALPLALRLLAGRLRAGGNDDGNSNGNGNGNSNANGNILQLRAPRFILERDAPGLIHTDGEPREAGARIEVEILPRSLRVMTPAAPAP